MKKSGVYPTYFWDVLWVNHANVVNPKMIPPIWGWFLPTTSGDIGGCLLLGLQTLLRTIITIMMMMMMMIAIPMRKNCFILNTGWEIFKVEKVPCSSWLHSKWSGKTRIREEESEIAYQPRVPLWKKWNSHLNSLNIHKPSINQP